MNGNLPITDGPRARITVSWFFRILPFAAIIAGYRMIPARFRANWNKNNDHAPTSHHALAEVLAGGGRKSFVYYTTPRFTGRRQPRGYAAAWALFLFVALTGMAHDHGVSWAN